MNWITKKSFWKSCFWYWMRNFCLLKSGIFFQKNLYEPIVTNNVTCSPKSSLGYTGIPHKVTKDSIRNPDYPSQSSVARSALIYRNILSFSMPWNDAFLKAGTPQGGALPFMKASITHGSPRVFGAGCTQQPLRVTVSHRAAPLSPGGRAGKAPAGAGRDHSTSPSPAALCSHLSLWEHFHPRVNSSFYWTEALTPTAGNLHFTEVFNKWCFHHRSAADPMNHTEIIHAITNHVRDCFYSLDNLGKVAEIEIQIIKN